MINGKIRFLLMFLALACIPLPAQGDPFGLYSTGVNSNGTGLQTQGAADLHYIITSTNIYTGPITVWPPNSSPLYDPTTGTWIPFPEPIQRAWYSGPHTAVVVYDVSNPWGRKVPNGPNSQWISPWANTRGEFGLLYNYQTTFDLTGLDPASAQIAGSWTTDNPGWMYLNGQLVAELPFWDPFQQLYGEHVDSPYSPGYIFNHDFFLTSGFLAGINTLEFLVWNPGDVGGGPTGLRVEIASATATPAAAPKLSCVGFESPVDSGPVIVTKKNRVLPLKAQLLDREGIPITGADIVSPPVLQVLMGNIVQRIQANQFVFTSEGKWQFNLMTNNYPAPGTYTISILTGDILEYVINPSCTATFVIE